MDSSEKATPLIMQIVARKPEFWCQNWRFLRFHRKRKQSLINTEFVTDEQEALLKETPVESMASVYQQYREALAFELIERVKLCTPGFFERLVIKLLIKMGYGGSFKDAGEAIGRTGDGQRKSRASVETDSALPAPLVLCQNISKDIYLAK